MENQELAETHITKLPSTVLALDGDSTIAIEVQAPTCKMIVYGTIITYGSAWSKYHHRMNGFDHRAKGWKLHCQAIAQNEKNLKQLRAKYPDHLVCLGGDLNQARIHPAKGLFDMALTKWL